MLMASLNFTAPAEIDDAHGPRHRPPAAMAELVEAHGQHELPQWVRASRNSGAAEGPPLRK